MYLEADKRLCYLCHERQGVYSYREGWQVGTKYRMLPALFIKLSCKYKCSMAERARVARCYILSFIVHG